MRWLSNVHRTNIALSYLMPPAPARRNGQEQVPKYWIFFPISDRIGCVRRLGYVGTVRPSGDGCMNAAADEWTTWLTQHGAALLLFARQWVPGQSDAED